MLQNALPPLSFSKAIIAAILFMILAQVPHLCVGQNGPYTIQTDEIKGTKSLLETATGKFVFKACTSIVGLEFDTSDPEYYLVVSGKTVQLFHVPSKATLFKKNVKNPADCYQIYKDVKADRKRIVFFTEQGRRCFLLSSSGILFPKNLEIIIDDISDIENTSLYLEVWAMVGEYDHVISVIDWEGKELIPPGNFDFIEFDSVYETFIFSKEKRYGGIDLSGNVTIPCEYTILTSVDGFYLAEKNDRFGIITPTKTILPFQFTKGSVYVNKKSYKDGVFYLDFENEPITIDTSASTLKKVNDFLLTYKTAAYYSDKYTTVYADRQFADEEVVAHIVNDETKEITVPSTYHIGTEHTPHLLCGGVGVTKDGKLGVMNIETGEFMIPLEYEPVYLQDISPGQRYLDNAFRLSWINRDRKEISDETVLLILKKGGKFGLVDLKGTVVVPFIYESINSTEKCSKDDLIMVQQNGLYGLLDKNTLEMKIPCEYEVIMDCHRAKKFRSDKDYIDLKIGK